MGDDGWSEGAIAARLASHGDHPAIITDGQVLSYAQLAARVRAFGETLGDARRLVLLAARNDVDSVVAYLAGLDRGHPVMLTSAANPVHQAALLARYDPDVTVACQAGGCDVVVRHERSVHSLHRDLALLLSTSGTTGSAKQVRLSRRNVMSNAAAIAAYLGITAADRAVTTLPMQYCYGLSVINSHLLHGATLVVTELSVVDRCFWDLFRDARATAFAGVPYTFELLDRVGFDDLELPTLRYVTQAGGRLAPDRVRHYAALGQRDGWDFVVMYGQTEATARMAYLPPSMALAHPGSIGVPIPGGSLRVDAPSGEESGELVYRGPNVMLGYAEHAPDLALGATVDELRTGDLARPIGGGAYEIVGRVSRFVKPYGLRVDLDQIERRLADDGLAAVVAGSDDGLVVGIPPQVATADIAALVGEHTGLPRSAIMTVAIDEVPRLANGKPDYGALAALAPAPSKPPAPDGARSDLLGRLRAIYTDVLGRPAPAGASFVSLGGDSLSYIEVVTRLEAELGTVPDGWHNMALTDLASRHRPRRRMVAMETNVVLRALAIVLVVGNHTDVWRLLGGAHVLLGIAGYNFARFTLRSGRLATSIARIALPSMCIIGVAAASRRDFSIFHALLVNAQFGGPDTRWGYWYVEALVQLLVPLALVVSIPAVRRFERGRELRAAFGVLAVGVALRFVLPATDHEISRAPYVLWLFALGWAAARARTARHRLAITAVLLLAVPGFTGEGLRDAVIAVGIALLVWVPRLPLPRPLTPVVGRLASASLYIYLTHWMVYPSLVEWSSPAAALIGSLVVGVAVAAVATPIATAIEQAIAGRHRRSTSRSSPDVSRRRVVALALPTARPPASPTGVQGA